MIGSITRTSTTIQTSSQAFSEKKAAGSPTCWILSTRMPT